MSVEDKQFTRELMRELGRRRNIDITDTRLTVARGIAYIGGVIRAAAGEYIDPKADKQSIIDGVRRIPGIRDVNFDARFEISSKK